MWWRGARRDRNNTRFSISLASGMARSVRGGMRHGARRKTART
jgi:hypothetical protein